MTANHIYKICTVSAWSEAEAAGLYRGSADDRRDGFVHFSTATQLRATAAKHFAGQRGLVLVTVDAEALGDALRWEPSRGGQLFPHLYGTLDVRHARAVVPLPWSETAGAHQFPNTLVEPAATDGHDVP
ncbi:MAG: DUF952 domain-containing protein [Myxococcota bacterium]